MVRIFSTQFPLDSRASLDDLLEIGKIWVAGSPYSSFEMKQLADLKNHGEYAENKSFRFDIGKAEGNDFSIVGIKYIAPENVGKIWTTSVVASREKNENWVSVCVDYDSSKAGLKVPSPKKPYIIKLLLQEIEGGLDGDLCVSEIPTYIRDDEAPFVADMLRGDVGSVMPIVYMSRDNNNLISMDHNLLARELSGVANVLVEPSKRFSFDLKDLTKGYNIFGGAVGIYWPEGFGRFFWLPENLRREENPYNTIYLKLIEGLNSRRLKKNLSWEDLQSAHNREAIEVLKNKEKNLRELEDNYRKQTDAKDKALATSGKRIESLEELEELYQGELDAKELVIADSNKRISFLENELRKAIANQVSGEGGIITSPEIEQMYEDEVKYTLVEALKNSASLLGIKTRKGQILDNIVESNPVNDDVVKKRIDRIKKLFRSYASMTGPMKRELQQMGFDVSKEGKHYKLFLQGQEGGLSVSIASTPGDKRTGKNTSQNIIRTFF